MNSEPKRRGRPPKAAQSAPAAPLASEESAPTSAPSSRGEIPPCPPDDPIHGDKIAAVVDWWFTYHPEEARKRYGRRSGTNVERWMKP